MSRKTKKKAASQRQLLQDQIESFDASNLTRLIKRKFGISKQQDELLKTLWGIAKAYFFTKSLEMAIRVLYLPLLCFRLGAGFIVKNDRYFYFYLKHGCAIATGLLAVFFSFALLVSTLIKLQVIPPLFQLPLILFADISGLLVAVPSILFTWLCEKYFPKMKKNSLTV